VKCKVCKAEKKGKGTYCDLHLKFYFYDFPNPLERLWRSSEKKAKKDKDKSSYS
jgi:hypothetical protein